MKFFFIFLLTIIFFKSRLLKEYLVKANIVKVKFINFFLSQLKTFLVIFWFFFLCCSFLFFDQLIATFSIYLNSPKVNFDDYNAFIFCSYLLSFLFIIVFLEVQDYFCNLFLNNFTLFSVLENLFFDFLNFINHNGLLIVFVFCFFSLVYLGFYVVNYIIKKSNFFF